MKRQKKYFEYRVVIAPDVRVGSREHCFTAYVPVLGIATSGDTIEEAHRNAEELIAFHLESLREEGELLPVEQPTEEFIATARVVIPA